MNYVWLGPVDRTAPNAVDPTGVGMSTFGNTVEMQWKRVLDNSGGIGVRSYRISRDGQYLYETRQSTFAEGAARV